MLLAPGYSSELDFGKYTHDTILAHGYKDFPIQNGIIFLVSYVISANAINISNTCFSLSIEKAQLP